VRAGRLHGHGDQLPLSTEDPYPGYDMDESGEVRITAASTRDLLASVVGRQLTDAAVMRSNEHPATASTGYAAR
jgi:hypothetical protein